MAEQPTNMAELIESVRVLVSTGATVIPTLATHSRTELSSAQRAVADRYLLESMVTAAGIVAVQKPGTVPALHQTDEYYRMSDEGGVTARLTGYVTDIGQRMR